MEANDNENYVYADHLRADILALIPEAGQVIGSIGCGQARTEAELVKAGRQVHGVDVSLKAVDVAKGRLTSARVISADDMMPFEENSLDGLILADVLEHLPLAWERLEQYVRMVKKGGWVVISVPNMRRIDILAKLVFTGDWPEDSAGVFDKTHIQVMTHKRVARWASMAGLKLERWYDAYPYRFWRHYIFKALDVLTFKYFKSFFHYQVVGLFVRK